MKKLFSIICLFAVCSAFAMSYYPGKYASAQNERNLKWSTCVWGNNVNFETTFLPSKPGSNDTVTVRPGNYVFELDGNYTVLSFATGDNARSFAKGKKFKFRKSMRASISCSPNGLTRQEWLGCVIDCGGPLEATFWDEARSAGRVKFQFVDTKLTARGDLVCIIPANPIIKNATRAGIEFCVEGASDIAFNGGAVVDSIISDMNDQWMFKWNIKDKDGKLPRVFFNRSAQFDKCDIELTVSDKVKPGVYGLIEFNDRKSGFTAPRSITVNGNDYTLGSEFKIGGKTAKLALAPFGKKDPKTPNDLVLTVGK